MVIEKKVPLAKSIGMHIVLQEVEISAGFSRQVPEKNLWTHYRISDQRQGKAKVKFLGNFKTATLNSPKKFKNLMQTKKNHVN